MTSKKIVFGLLSAGLAISACSSLNSKHSEAERNPASMATWENLRAMPFGTEQLSHYSSTGQMALQKAELLTDNNRAFQRKLEMVKSAKSEINMVYYIYSDDFSSSLFSSEVIAAARRGVKVQILVDFITNYGRLDLFTYMESVSNGNLKVRFYGLPSEVVQRGAVYQTVPCSKKTVETPEQCQAEKVEVLNALGNPRVTWFSKMYLTGLYGKNPGLLQAAVGLGGQFDPKALQAGGAPSAEQKKQLLEFAKLVARAEFKNDLGAKLKVGIALQTYSSTLNPIMNEITGRLPIVNKGGDDWDHLTDYTHHKFMMVDGEKFIMGGRNIEDSYHSDGLKKQIPDSTGKYTFMDTDFYAETREAKNLKSSYDRLFLFGPMTGSLEDVQALTPNEYDINAVPFKMSLGACLQEGKATPQDLESCVNSKIPTMPGYQSLKARLTKIQGDMDSNGKAFLKYKITTDKSWKSGGDELDPSDLGTAQAFYLENLNSKPSARNKRSFGSKIGLEAEHGKMIHAAWIKGIENVCATSLKAKQRKRVVLHTAYFFLPSGLTNAIGNMINGKWNCSYVDVALITNSFETTDLNVINIFARYQLQALLAFNRDIEANKDTYVTANQYKARLKYYEYTPVNDGTGVSLHSKVSILGDDVMVGSANGDVRSYFMDTNNAIYIRNASKLVADYSRFIDQLIATHQIVDKTNAFANVTDQQLKHQNKEILNALVQRWDKKGKLTKERQEGILKYVDDLGSRIRQTTQAIIRAHFSVNSAQFEDGGGQTRQKKMEELDQQSNGFDAMWKVL